MTFKVRIYSGNDFKELPTNTYNEAVILQNSLYGQGFKNINIIK